MNRFFLRVYSRSVEEGRYPNGLAYSVHFGIVKEGRLLPLRNNYGMLFPKASVDDRNVLAPSFVRNIRVAAGRDGVYYITGEDVTAEGINKTDCSKKLWCWTTTDFVSFVELGLTDTDAILSAAGISHEELRKSDEIEITPEKAEELSFIHNSYASDNSAKAGEDPLLKFPLTRGYGDPVVLLWKDEYYFIATNDNLNDIGLYVRKAHELKDLFCEGVTEYLILDRDEKRGLIQTFWAPEFHVINGSLYILFAVSNENWGPQCHLMRLKDGGDILKPEDWEDPVKVKAPGGKPLGANGITLDMTYVHSGSRHYYVWSYREHIGSPLDSGSMLMVAEFLPEKPDELITGPVCLSRPLYGFENTSGTINNEGPYAFYHNGKIYLAYSGGDARGYLYTVGMLTAEDGADLCDIASWEKAKTPALSLASVPGELGPGHNSFFKDRNGDLWIAYHAVRFYDERIISVGMRRVLFDHTNTPRLF